MIDVGSPAINLSRYSLGGQTIVGVDNPANASGVIDTFQLYNARSMTGLKLGTFSKDGNILTNRDYVSIGNSSGGAPVTFTGLSVDIEIGDIVGHYTASGSTEITQSGGGKGVWFKSGDQFEPGTPIDYGTQKDNKRNIALYGTGEEVSAGSKAFMHYYRHLMYGGVGRC
jgi:hypothetical protein